MAGEGKTVHRLHLSATPIPRTLALTVWGDLDLSEIRGLPSGRLPIETEVVTEAGRPRAFEHLKTEVAAGRQGFVICPLVEESEAVRARAAETEFARLAEGELAGCRIGLLHGRLDPAAKEAAMTAFAAGEVDVLVATTVVEVGIDVPNATVMIIEGAESFGLAQLHQLRGRIGRGDAAGRCFLVTGRAGAASARRLEAVAEESDGFRLAELDLELRGEGELAGRRQHGLPRFRVARLPEDAELLIRAREDLRRIDSREGGLSGAILAPAVEAAMARFGPAGVI
jgi:ATP-dependent DNA helicase RecG